jgi:hypothetical protein
MAAPGIQIITCGRRYHGRRNGVGDAETLVLEFDGATEDAVKQFADALENAGTTVMPLAQRDAGMVVSLLVGVGTSFLPTLAELLVTHFRKRAVSIRIKRKGGHDLTIICDDDLAPSSLTSVIEDFLTK